jgi:predicted metal-dependent phosphotriesterase family hydrolase
VFLFDGFVPALRAAGVTERELRALLEQNPAAAFAVRMRPKRA